MKVKAWSKKVSIPTYEIGTPEKNPIFLEKRVYQGSSGVVYPYPVVEKISDQKIDKEWQACYLENDFVKIMILPELGGRVQMAYDKTKQRHFVYYNEVIKPALVGLTGPWISGGIEFNWPQHHRPTTYDPVDFSIEENEDGSKTVWCSEIERMFRTKGMAGFTLYPDRSYLEIRVKLYNRTSQPQTFLWWANPAVAVNDSYQSVFPPDVNAVFDHGKRDVSTFPIATGTYYKVDYSRGVDISRYKNIPVPTSYMAIESKYDFVGGYENDTRGGLLHVANHHVSPGKKQWTWGNGDFGRAWDRNLTDRNGPYIELMCGVYTDNQPDFSWLMPYEEKAFTQYFMPYRDLGRVKNATKDVLLNLEFIENVATARVYSTGIFKNVRVVLKHCNRVILDERCNLDPASSYLGEVALAPGTIYTEIYLGIYSEKGELLLDYSTDPGEKRPVPEAAKAAKRPEEIKTNEELFLNGLHLEQYRHATYNPDDYYREALMRDPGDIRCNNALGMRFLRKGKFAFAEKHFKQALETMLLRNPNPYDGEPLFNLGLALQLQGKDDEAYKHFYKSVWNAAFMDSGYFHLAMIDAKRGNFDLALENISRSLIRNWHNHKARHLKVAILRKQGKHTVAKNLSLETLEIDHFNFGVLYEQYLLGMENSLDQMIELIRGNIYNFIEIALDYAWSGLFGEAIRILELGISVQESVLPLAYYYLAWLYKSSGDSETAKQMLVQAEACLPDYCFPNQIDAVPVLELAMEMNPSGPKAPFYLGNFWYNARQYDEALKCFELSAELDSTYPTVFRNLALAYYNKFDMHQKGLECMEKAFELEPNDSRVFMELYQLYKRMNKSLDFRMNMLRTYPELVDQRDDMYLEQIELHLHLKEYEEGYTLLAKRKFHPWEGGEGKVSGAYIRSCVGLAKKAFEKSDFRQAVSYLEKAKIYPENLGEGKLAGAQENQVNYWLGCAYEELGDMGNAMKYWTEASTGLSEPAVAWYYNDQRPDTIYYQGLALQKLGESEGAHDRFGRLFDYGEEHLYDVINIDYFAVSLPDLQIWEEDLDKRNRLHCKYMMALGNRGLSKLEKANMFVNQILEEDCAYAGVIDNLN